MSLRRLAWGAALFVVAVAYRAIECLIRLDGVDRFEHPLVIFSQLSSE